MKREELILQYCIKLTEALQKTDIIDTLDDNDQKLMDDIYSQKNIDSHPLSAKCKSEMEILLYDECNRFVRIIFTQKRSYDIVSGIDAVERYFALLQKEYDSKFNCKMPYIYENIKDLVRIRLQTIELICATDQEMHLRRTNLEKLVCNYKDEISQNITQERERIETELLETIDIVDDTIDDVEERRLDIYKDIITIISIFAGIILAFAGVFSFSDAIFANFNGVNFYKLLVISSVVCLFILTLFSSLYFFVYNIRYERVMSDDDRARREKLPDKKDSPDKKAKVDKKETKRERNKIRKHKWSLLVPLAAAFLVFVTLIFTIVLVYPHELSKDDSEQETVAITTTTQNSPETEQEPSQETINDA